MNPHAPDEFAQNARDALQDAHLRSALRAATDTFASRRRQAIAEVPEWEALRQRARAIKDEVLADLPGHVDRFAAAAARAGAIVHRAADAAAACAIVRRIAEERGARHIVKSKSMATEEIGLNAALAAAGLEPIETDLGEWIVQLAGETPSHIIVPAIHKTRASIGRLFTDRLGIEPTDDPQRLAAHAQERLRRAFASADLGVSGVNFGVAETGTILILENEGNARMTTTLPAVHVAVMGIEKVIPRFCDLEVFLRLLPRSGTGQHLTSYQSLLTGPDPAGEGPRELHVVLLDNGRSAIARDAVMRQTLACIRCGACLNACPVYQSVGGHAYGSVYPGPIGAILAPQLHGGERAAELPFASSLCGACKDVCPVAIDIPTLLLELRQRARSAPRRRGRLERLGFSLWAWAMRGPRRYALAGWLARQVQRLPFVARRLPLLSAWHGSRVLPRLARRSFRSEWARRGQSGRGDHGAGGRA